jgi:DNA-binding SARP family transcriptional activator
MAPVQIRLLGRFQVVGPSGRKITLAARKGQLLLAVLAAHAPDPVRRERLTGLLWGDLPEERARHSLRQLLSTMRKQLPVLRGNEEISLDLQACSVDAVELRQLAARQERDALERAVARYEGPLLDGLDGGDWLLGERKRLADAAAGAMAELAAIHAAANEHAAAAGVLQRWIELDPCAEEAHRLRMRALDAMGERSAALQQYQRCVDALRRDLGTAPSAETTALYLSMRDAGIAPVAQSQDVHALPSVAVFPFTTLTRDASLGELSVALGEDLGSHLARLPGFEILAERAVASAAQEAGADIRRVARALSARYLVTGSLRRLEDGALRIAVQLLEGQTAQYLWTELTDLPPRPRQGEMDEFAAAIAAKLEQRLTLAAAKGSDRPTQAWDAVRRGSSVLFSRGWSQEAVVEAIDLYRQAVSLDPALALARAQKALIIALASRWGLIGGTELYQEARQDAERALAMEPNKSDVLGYAGCAIADLGDPRRAIPILERAVQENAGNAQAWAALGATQLLLRQVEEGVESLRRGLRISPTDYRRSVWQTALAGGLARLKRHDEAVEVAQAACRSDVNFAPARIVLAGALMKLGRESEAGRALAEARRLRPRLSVAEVRLWVGNRSLDKFDAGLTPLGTPG